MRLIVTGYSAGGDSTIVFDGPADEVTDAARPGFSLSPVLSTDAPQIYPATEGRIDGDFPGVTGSRVNVIVFPPGHGTGDQRTGLGMHATDTTDVTFMLSGQALLVMGDGSETVVSAGDVLVQHGTLHEWRVPFDEPCRYAVILLGARRE